MDLEDGIAEAHGGTQETPRTRKDRLENDVGNRAPSLKLVVLATLVLLNVTGNLSTSYARTRPGDMFAASSAVVTAELIKLCACLALVYRTECRSSGKRLLSLLNDRLAKRPADTLNVCVPSLVYLLHNNLEYVAVSNLDVATYQVVSQSKILATAVCSVLVLRRAPRARQWIALAVLAVGVVLVQLDAGDAPRAPRPTRRDQNRVTGLASAAAGSCLSGFAGVYLEKILKADAGVSLWMRNVQLSLVSLPMGLAVCLASNWHGVSDFFFGYDCYVVYLICLKSAGGLAVSMAIKHADMLVKEFAVSLAICITCVFAVYLFDFKINARFVAGATLVVFSIIVYSYAKPKESPSPNVV